MHHVPVLYRALYPILVITQTIPTVALAALLRTFLGSREAALFITHDIDGSACSPAGRGASPRS